MVELFRPPETMVGEPMTAAEIIEAALPIARTLLDSLQRESNVLVVTAALTLAAKIHLKCYDRSLLRERPEAVAAFRQATSRVLLAVREANVVLDSEEPS